MRFEVPRDRPSTPARSTHLRLDHARGRAVLRCFYLGEFRSAEVARWIDRVLPGDPVAAACSDSLRAGGDPLAAGGFPPVTRAALDFGRRTGTLGALQARLLAPRSPDRESIWSANSLPRRWIRWFVVVTLTGLITCFLHYGVLPTLDELFEEIGAWTDSLTAFRSGGLRVVGMGMVGVGLTGAAAVAMGMLIATLRRSTSVRPAAVLELIGVGVAAGRPPATVLEEASQVLTPSGLRDRVAHAAKIAFQLSAEDGDATRWRPTDGWADGSRTLGESLHRSGLIDDSLHRALVVSPSPRMSQWCIHQWSIERGGMDDHRLGRSAAAGLWVAQLALAMVVGWIVTILFRTIYAIVGVMA